MFSYHFYAKFKGFLIFNIFNIPELGISRKIIENIGERHAEK